MKLKTKAITVKRVDNAWLMAELGAKLQALRQARGLTLQQVASALEVTRASVNNWELGKAQTGFLVERLYNIAIFYDVPVTKLLP